MNRVYASFFIVLALAALIQGNTSADLGVRVMGALAGISYVFIALGCLKRYFAEDR